MYTNSLLAVSSALFAVVAGVPMAEPHGHHHKHRRDYVVVPYTEVVVETIPITVTVWVEPSESTPTATPTSYPPAPKYDAPEPSSSEPAATTPASYTAPAPAPYTPETSSTSTTSVYVAPVPTTTTTIVTPAPYVAPTTPAAYVAPTTSTTTPAPAATTSSSSGSSVGGMAAAGKMYTGDLTWYDVGLGACGKTNVASDPVIAIPEAIFDAYSTGNPNTNPLCGKTISITGKDGTKFTGTVVDRCPGCTVNDLDLSQDFFNKVTNNGDGRVGGMSWCFDD